MGRARDEAGNVWETDAQGNPVRLVSPAPEARAQPTVTAIPTSPQQQRENARNDRGEQRDDVRIGISQRGEERADRGEVRDVRNKVFDHTMELKKAFDAMPGVKEYRTALPQFVQGIKTANTPQGDLALIYAYAKIMDPGSVVREGEAASVASADTFVGQKIAALQKQLEGTGTFSAEARDNLRQEMLVKIGELKRAYDTQRQRSIADAQAYGIDPVRVVGQHDGGPSVREEILKHWPNQKGAASVFDQDTVGPGAPGGLASGGDTNKSTPIPPEMQSEYEAYVQANRGRLDPQAYAQFRRGLDEKYGFGLGGDVYEQEAQELNDAAKNGGRLNLRIPPANESMTIGDKVKSSFFNSTPGAVLAGAADFHGGLDEIGAMANLAINPQEGWDTSLARADQSKQALADQYPNATIGGQILGGIVASGVTGAAGFVPSTIGRTLATGAGAGAATGALENNENRLLGATTGAGLGIAGGAAGRYVAAPIAERIMRTDPMQSLSNGIRTKLLGRDPLAIPHMTGGERILSGQLDIDSIQSVRDRMAEASKYNLPFSLADADPRLRALAGSATRRSPDAFAEAELPLEMRSRGQADRAIDAVNDYLAEVTDIPARRAELIDAGRITAAPYYNQAYAAGRTGQNLADMSKPTPDPELQAMLSTPTGQQALGGARRIAADQQSGTRMTGIHTSPSGEMTFRESPNLETLDLTKRGFDDILEAYRDPITHRLNLDERGRAIEGLRSRFVDAVDQRFPVYKEARAAYQPFAQRAEALVQGTKGSGSTITPRDITRVTGSMTPEQLDEYRRGFATSIADQIDRTRLSGDPYDAVYGSPAQQAKFGQLFPKAGDFGNIYNLERDMKKTAQEVLGGSQTARRQAADNALGDVLTDVVDTGTQVSTGGGMSGASLGRTIVQGLSSAAKYGIGKKAEANAADVSRILLDQNTPVMQSAMDDFMARWMQQQSRNADFRNRFGLFGSITTPSAVPYRSSDTGR